MASVKFVAVSRGLGGILDYVTNREKTTDSLINHIIMNSVNFETGRKFHQSAREMQQAKEFSNQLCMQYGLSVTEVKADPNRIPAWKKRLRQDIKRAMELWDTVHQMMKAKRRENGKVRYSTLQGL